MRIYDLKLRLGVTLPRIEWSEACSFGFVSGDELSVGGLADHVQGVVTLVG